MPFENCLIFVNGFQVDENYILKENDLCTIREFPRDFNPTGATNRASQFWEWFLGITTLGGWTLFSHAYYQFNKENIFDKAYREMAEEAVKNALESSSSNKNKSDVETIPSLLGAKNHSSYDAPYPIVLGKHLYTPRYIGMPYTTIDGTDGETQWYHAMFLLGYNDLLVQDIKLDTLDLASNKPYEIDEETGEKVYLPPVMNGEIPVDSILFADEYNKNEIKLELQQGENEISFYDEKVVQEDLQLELTCVKLEDESLQYCPLTRFSAKNPRVVELEFSFPSLIGYDSKNNPQNADVDLKIEYSNDAGNTWYEFGRIEGCTSYNSKTRTSHFSMQKAKNMRFVARKEFTITDAFAEAMLDNGRTYELRIIRTSPNSIDNNVADKVYLTAIRTWCYDYTKTKENYDIAEDKSTVELVKQRPMIEADRNRTARLGIKIKASDKFTGTLDSVNMILTSYARTWNGEEWSTTESPTNNPASLFLKLLQSPSRGNKKYSDEKIDLDNLGELYEFCNQPMSETDSNPRYTCNTVIYNEMKTSDIINKILQTGRASISMKGNQYGVVIDKPMDTPLAILNNQNILSFSAKKSFDELPSGLRIEFINAHNGYETDEAIVLYEGKSLDDDDLVLKKVKLDYITDPKQAVKEGYYELAKLKLRPETWSLSVSSEGNLFEVGSLVEIQTDTILVGVGDGAEVLDLIIDGNYLKGIKTDGTFEVGDASKEYGVKIFIANGVDEPSVLKAKVKTIEAGTYRDLYFDSPIYMLGEQKIPTVGDIISFGEYDKITTLAICTGKKEDENGKFSCTFIPYDENVYTAESGDIPEFDSKTTSIHSAVIPNVELPYATKNELMEVASKIPEIIEEHKNPDAPSNVSAVAEIDKISLYATTNGVGDDNVITSYEWQYKKRNDEYWNKLDSSNYIFNRFKSNTNINHKDSYYEIEDFDNWYFRVRAINTYGLVSNWVNCAISVSEYGTWKLSSTNVFLPKHLDRTIILEMTQQSRSDNLKQFGIIKYRVEVSRYDDISPSGERMWFKPATSLNPYASEDNYKDGTGYVTVDNTFIQTVPLKGQNNNKIENTEYYYRITTVLYDPDTLNEVTRNDPIVINAKALCSNIQDLINADESAKEEINVKELSAITANLGKITDGYLKGNESNYWTLSTKNDAQQSEKNEDFQGAFRVGGTDEYIQVKPILENGIIKKYEVSVKVGSFDVNSGKTKIDNTIFLYDDNDYSSHGSDTLLPYHTKRLCLSHTGLVLQRNNGTADNGDNAEWISTGQLTIDDAGNMFLTNENLAGDNVPKASIYIEDSCVYHFDNVLTDENKGNGAELIFEDCTFEQDNNCLFTDTTVVNGTIKKDINISKDVCFFIKDGYVQLNDDYICESDAGHPADYNVLDKTTWSSTELPQNLFKVK